MWIDRICQSITVKQVVNLVIRPAVKTVILCIKNINEENIYTFIEEQFYRLMKSTYRKALLLTLIWMTALRIKQAAIISW